MVATDRPIDYYTYVIASYGFGHGVNPYSASDTVYDTIGRVLGLPSRDGAGHYLYSPLTALVVWPLLLLSPRVGATVWLLASGLAALGAALLLGAGADLAWKKRLILCGSIGFLPTLASMSLGQVSGFVLFFTAGALYYWRRHREVGAGVTLAIGLWLKPLAIALVGLALWRARWRSVVAILVASAITAFACAVAYGPPVLLSQSGLYMMVLHSSQDLVPRMVQIQSPENQNLLGLLSRWLTTNKYGPPLVNAPQITIPMYWALAAVVLVVSLALLRPLGTDWRWFDIEVAFLIVTSQLLSPVTEINHLALSFIAYAVLIERWNCSRRSSWKELALALAYAMINVHVILRYSLWSQLVVGITPLLDLGTWAEIIVWVLLANQLRNRSRADRDLAFVSVSATEAC